MNDDGARSGAPPLLARVDSRHLAAGLFLLALAVRGLYLLQYRHSPLFDFVLGDGKGYLEWARTLAAGDWLGDAVFYQAPLYPYVLGLLHTVFGDSLWVVRLVQAAWGSLACALLFLAGERLFGRVAGLAAGLLACLYAPAVFFDGLVQKASLALFLTSLLLWALTRAVDDPRRRRWLALGACLGALILVRENALLLAVVACAWPWTCRAWSTRQRGLCSAFCVLGLLCLLGPVGVRNWSVDGALTLTTAQLGPNLWLGNNPEADGLYRPLIPGHGSYVHERRDATELAERAVGRSLSPQEVSDYWLRRVRDFVVDQPATFVRLTWRKFVLLWSRHEIPDTDDFQVHQQASWLLRALGALFHFGTLAPLAAAGLATAWKAQRRNAALLAVLLAVLAAGLLPFVSYGRYRLVMVPALLLLAGCAVDAGWRLWRARARPAAAPLLAPLLAAAVAGLAWWPSFPVERSLALGYHNLGLAHGAGGQLQPAVAALDEALRLDPRRHTSWNNRGILHARMGRTQQALHDYEQALRLRPDYGAAYYNRGLTRFEQRRFAEALADYDRALGLDPDNAEILVNRGAVYAEQGRPQPAIADFTRALELAPQDVEAYLNRAMVWLKVQQPQRALADVDAAVGLAPGNVEAFNRRGAVHFHLQRYDEAAADFTRAIDLQPDRGDLHRNRGWAYALGPRRLQEACRDWRQGCRLGACPPWERVREFGCTP